MPDTSTRQKAAEFDPAKFEDRYDAALVDLVNRKRHGQQITPVGKPREGTNVVDLMTALQQSLKGGAKPVRAKKKPPKRAAGQKEMLLPISGKKAGREATAASKLARAPRQSRKDG